MGWNPLHTNYGIKPMTAYRTNAETNIRKDINDLMNDISKENINEWLWDPMFGFLDHKTKPVRIYDDGVLLVNGYRVIDFKERVEKLYANLLIEWNEREKKEWADKLQEAIDNIYNPPQKDPQNKNNIWRDIAFHSIISILCIAILLAFLASIKFFYEYFIFNF